MNFIQNIEHNSGYIFRNIRVRVVDTCKRIIVVHVGLRYGVISEIFYTNNKKKKQKKNTKCSCQNYSWPVDTVYSDIIFIYK